MTSGIDQAQAFALSQLLDMPADGVASRVINKTPGGVVTLFAFAAGQGLSEHTAPFDALVLVIDGNLKLTIGGVNVDAAHGTIVRLPARVPHAVDALVASRMLLIMLRDPKAD